MAEPIAGEGAGDDRPPVHVRERLNESAGTNAEPELDMGSGPERVGGGDTPLGGEDDGGLGADPCLSCRLGFHNECDSYWQGATLAGGDGCCCGGDTPLARYISAMLGESSGDDGDFPDLDDDAPEAYFDGFTGTKALTKYRDPVSTGRKEAAVKFPIKIGQKCEWAFQKDCGGGVVPIVGCVGYPATDIHHGPDKNTLRNVVGNVHRICANCHNRWHGANDPHYGPRPPADQPFLPMEREWVDHAPVKATDDEIFEEEKRRRNDSRKHGNLD